MKDSIIREVETTRERLAERFDFDVRKIAAYLKSRSAERRESRPPFDREKSTSRVSTEGSE